MHTLWDIPPTAGPDELTALVQAHSGIEMHAEQYGNSVYLSSDAAQSIVMFGMPVSLSAVYEKGVLSSISISCVQEGGIFYESMAPSQAQLEEAALQGLVSFLEIAAQLEEKYGQFTGGQISEVGEFYESFPVDGQGNLDLNTFQNAMWASNETTLELHNENIMVGLKSFFDYGGGDDVIFCLSLYTVFSYAGTSSDTPVQRLQGTHLDMEALADAAEAALAAANP